MPPPMLKNLIGYRDFKSRTIGCDFRNRLREWRSLSYLRADVHLHAHDIDGAHFRGALVNRRDAIQRDAEFVLA